MKTFSTPKATDGGTATVRSRPFRRGAAALLCGFVVLLAGVAGASGQPTSRKQALIRDAMAQMRLDARIQSLVDQRVEARVQRARIDNPGLPDSAAAVVRSLVAGVYAENRAGRDGLDARVLAVFERHLTEEDLKFISDFSGSDQGKRYREVVPRIVRESVEAGTRWAEQLEPEIRRRLETRFRAEGYRF